MIVNKDDVIKCFICIVLHSSFSLHKAINFPHIMSILLSLKAPPNTTKKVKFLRIIQYVVPLIPASTHSLDKNYRSNPTIAPTKIRKNKKFLTPFLASSYENQASRIEHFFRIKSEHSGNYRGTCFFPPGQKRPRIINVLF